MRQESEGVRTGGGAGLIFLQLLYAARGQFGTREECGGLLYQYILLHE